MISRCPSCAAQVHEDAARCPSCHWDFKARRRIPPPGAEPAEVTPPPSAPAEEAQPLPGLGGLKLVPFADALTEVKPPQPKIEPPPKAAEPPPKAAEPAPKPLEPPAPKPAAEPKLRDGLPRLRPEDQRLEPPAAAPEARRGPKPDSDLLKDLPRERPAEPSAAQPAAAPAPAAAPPRPQDPEPPKTVIRAPEPAKPQPLPRPIDFPARPPSAEAPPASPAPARAGSAALWTAGAAVLLVLGAAAAYFLSPRKDSDVGEKPSLSAGDIFAQARPAAPVEPPQVAAPAAPAAATTPPVVPPSAAAAAAPDQAAPLAASPAPAAPGAPASPAPVRHGVVVLLKTPTLPAEFAAAAPKPAPQAAQWVFEGRVYDLIGLNDVSGAQLQLVGPGGVAAETTTAADGRYTLSVDPLESGGYKLELRHPDYLSRTLDEVDPPFSQAPLEDRKMAAAGRGSKPWVAKTPDPVKRDIVAIPKNTDE